MSGSWRARWNLRHASADGPGEVARVLLANRHLLPASGRVLDLACGRGGNALWLAEQGLEVHAWDFSPVAIARLREAARASGLQIHAQVRDVVASPPEPGGFDMVFCAHFLERALAPAMAAALKPGGRLFFQTFVRDCNRGRGPSTPDWRLAPNELLALFSMLRIHYYLEECPLGDGGRGTGDLALLVASAGHGA